MIIIMCIKLVNLNSEYRIARKFGTIIFLQIWQIKQNFNNRLHGVICGSAHGQIFVKILIHKLF